MTKKTFPNLPMDESETARLVQAALDGPAHPLRSDQVDALVRAAAASRPLAPGWVLLFLAAGPLVVILLGVLNNFNVQGLPMLALAIPLANLALSPFAALLLVIRLRRREPVTKSHTHRGDLL